MGFAPDVTIGDVSVFEAQENLANENLTMKTRNALCHMQVVILHSKTSFSIGVTKGDLKFCCFSWSPCSLSTVQRKDQISSTDEAISHN